MAALWYQWCATESRFPWDLEREPAVVGTRGELIKIEPRRRGAHANKGELRHGKGEENVGGRVDGA